MPFDAVDQACCNPLQQSHVLGRRLRHHRPPDHHRQQLAVSPTGCRRGSRVHRNRQPRQRRRHGGRGGGCGGEARCDEAAGGGGKRATAATMAMTMMTMVARPPSSTSMSADSTAVLSSASRRRRRRSWRRSSRRPLRHRGNGRPNVTRSRPKQMARLSLRAARAKAPEFMSLLIYSTLGLEQTFILF